MGVPLDTTQVDVICAVLVLILWVGYARFAKLRARTSFSVSRALHTQRLYWIKRLLKRDNRVADVGVLRGIEHSVIFFASSTVLVIGAMLTVLFGEGMVDVAMLNIQAAGGWVGVPREFKMVCVLLIFIHAFFQFTWAVRQYSFFSVLLGSAPMPEEIPDYSAEEIEEVANDLARLADRAGHAFNFGLRAWYFALAFCGWFISPYAMLVGAIIVVLVLYRREFRSKSLQSMVRSLKRDKLYCEGLSDKLD